MNKINWILFSRDRACQLELLLRSTKEYFKEYKSTKISVLYTYSNCFFKQGYNKVIDEYPEINFVKENNFKSDLVKLIDDENKYTIFFVDDQVFKEPFSMNEIPLLTDDIACISLRLHPRLNYCYTMNIQMTPTNSTKWLWKNFNGDNNYVMSLDSHIFLTTDIKPYLVNLQYKNPNSLEGILACYPINKPYMICFEKSKTINNPCNKVQTNNPNKHGNVSAEYINQEFLNGKVIDLEPFRGLENESCHKEMPIIFKQK
jgi:hypothetical protein